MRAVVMAGGRGERLRPLTDTCPKPLLPVAGRPVLDRLLEKLSEAGIQDVTLAVGYLGQMIEDYVLDGARWGVRADYVRQVEPMGTAGALALLADKSEPVLVVNGDKVFQRFPDLALVADGHKQGKTLAIIGTKWHIHRLPAGVVNLKYARYSDYRPITEKPQYRWRTVAGVYALSPILVRAVKEEFLDMPDLICRAAPNSIRARNLLGYVLDIGTPATYEAACARLS